MPFTRVYGVGVWLGSVRYALLLAVVLRVDCGFDSWGFLGLLGFLCVSRRKPQTPGTAKERSAFSV